MSFQNHLTDFILRTINTKSIQWKSMGSNAFFKINFCVPQKSMTWGWVNYRIIILRWTVPVNIRSLYRLGYILIGETNGGIHTVERNGSYRNRSYTDLLKSGEETTKLDSHLFLHEVISFWCLNHVNHIT